MRGERRRSRRWDVCTNDLPQRANTTRKQASTWFFVLDHAGSPFQPLLLCPIRARPDGKPRGTAVADGHRAAERPLTELPDQEPFTCDGYGI